MEEVAKHEVELKLEDVKKYIAPNATDKELFMFMGIAKSYGLNPWKREIHFIKYGNSPGQTVVGYETYIKRAERTGLLDGWECTSDGKKAFVIIYRKDRSKPFKWEVDFAEFNTGQSTWKKMPSFMLKKVAIAQAFRLCFPEDLGGLPYMPEEITGGQSEHLPSDDPKQEEALKEEIRETKSITCPKNQMDIDESECAKCDQITSCTAMGKAEELPKEGERKLPETKANGNFTVCRKHGDVEDNFKVSTKYCQTTCKERKTCTVAQGLK